MRCLILLWAMFVFATVIFSSVSYAPQAKRMIVGGIQVPLGSFIPYQVALMLNSNFLCGGSIISPVWILTAAHCLYRRDLTDLYIRAGTNNYIYGGVQHRAKWSIYHPGYPMDTDINDVALILLESPLQLGPRIKCIHLAKAGAVATEGSRARISGWGSVNPRVIQGIPDLRYAYVPVVSIRLCSMLYPRHHVYEDSSICAGYVGGGGIDACYGDSGGPFVIGNVQYGIVSWGTTCAEPYKPGVYSNVAGYSPWIEEVMVKFAGPLSSSCTVHFETSDFE